MLAIATITILETVRRRVVAIVGLASLGLVAVIGWGFFKLSQSMSNDHEAAAVEAVLTILVAFAFSVVLAVGSSFLAAPAIAGEIESGIALAVLPRPLPRVSYLLGKWLGLGAIVIAYAAAFGTLALLAIRVACGYVAPNEPLTVAYLVGQSLVLFTLSLAISTRLTPIAGGIVSVACFGIAWIAGITAPLADALGATALSRVAQFAGLIVPSDGLWRGAVYHLTPVAILTVQAQMPRGNVNPFSSASPPPVAFSIWCALWIAGVLALAAASLRSRDV